jgi:hypothetical protein
MKILNPDSLVKTVDNFNEASCYDIDWLVEAGDLADWISKRLGKEGGYLGSFAMTESDWEMEFRLFTGERIITKAGRAHVIAEEASRVLRIIEEETGVEIRLSLRIFENIKSQTLETGDYCCGTCSVSLWRYMNSGGFGEYSKIYSTGLRNLAVYRSEKGGWRRYPFYYTMLALWESKDPISRQEINFQRSTCLRRLRFLANRTTDKYSKRKLDLLGRVVAEPGIGVEANR